MLEKLFVWSVRIVTVLYILVFTAMLVAASGYSPSLLAVVALFVHISTLIILFSGTCMWFSNPSRAHGLLFWGAVLAIASFLVFARYSVKGGGPLNWKDLLHATLSPTALIPIVILISLFVFHKPGNGGRG